MSDPLNLDIERPKVMYRQIGDQIRSLILNGQLPPGAKLPPTTELAAKWNTHAATIHAALSPLVKEGLLMRRPKIGTFVSKRTARLSQVAVYYDSDIWCHEANAFKRAVHVELTRLLQTEKIGVQVLFDPRPAKQHGKAWPQLAAAAERREFQALIATDVPQDVVKWMQQLPVPAAYFTYASVPNKVALDFGQFAEASVAYLKQQGCRSAGVISILEPGQPASQKSSTLSRDFYEYFTEVCRLQGLDVRKEWIRTAHGFVPDESQEEFGYNEFKEIWRQPDRPEGLVVFPDTSVPGVITAILEQRVSVPDELKLVAHKHSEINFLCPIEISFLYSSTQEIARALFSQIQRQLSGEVCVPIVLPFKTGAKARSPKRSRSK